MNTEEKKELEMKRKWVEKELGKNFKGEIGFEELKTWILESEDIHSDGHLKYQKKWSPFVSKKAGNDIKKFDKLAEIFSAAWNHFPHKAMNGLSPFEKSISIYGSKNSLQNKGGESRSLDDVKFRVGDYELNKDQYFKMLEEMEEAQKPFKEWYLDVLEEYKKFVKYAKLSPSLYGVAEIFFERSCQIGFVDYGEIKLEFAVHDFPMWYLTHVMDSESDISESSQVREAVCSLIKFIDVLAYESEEIVAANVKRFGGKGKLTKV
jgi:hypothetical protein